MMTVPGVAAWKVIGWVSPLKDADCLTMENLGRLWAGEPRTLPCTPAGVTDSACFRQFVTQFGQRAFRRPLDADEIDAYTALAASVTTLMLWTTPGTISCSIAA